MVLVHPWLMLELPLVWNFLMQKGNMLKLNFSGQSMYFLSPTLYLSLSACCDLVLTSSVSVFLDGI